MRFIFCSSSLTGNLSYRVSAIHTRFAWQADLLVLYISTEIAQYFQL